MKYSSEPARSIRSVRRSRSIRSVAGLSAFTAVAALAPISSSAATKPTQQAVQFQQYSTCPRLLNALRTLTLPYVGPWGLGGGVMVDVMPRMPMPVPMPTSTANAPVAAATAAPQAAPVAKAAPVSAEVAGGAAQSNSSATNVQEAGVDEGDSVENDGRYLFASVRGAIRIIDTVNGRTVANLGNATGNEKLLLDGNRLAITRQSFDQYAETIVELWDVSTRTNPVKLSETHLEGNAVAVRSVNHRARIVLSTDFAQRLRFTSPQNTDSKSLEQATAANQAIVKKAPVESWLPRSYVVRADGSRTPISTSIDCREVGKPVTPSGLGFTWVATLDLDVPNARLGARGSGGVIAQGQTVYASQTGLYVATSNWGQVNVPQPFGIPSRRLAPVRPVQPRISIHQFDLGASDGATYVATGSVDGTLLNQFSMSEYNGDLRVATTTQRVDFGTNQESGVHVFRRNGRVLQEIGSVGGLGKTEQIYAVRFVGDLGYVVTFRRTDPLYVIDLRNPASPRMVGELKIPGYSSYLHPIGPGRLLGIGQDATPEGRVTGTQLSLFDVSNPTAPRQLSTLKIGGSSDAEYDHMAFLYWPKTKQLMVPFNNYDNQGSSSGVIVANVGDASITEQGRVQHLVTQSIGVGPFPIGIAVGEPVPGQGTTTVPQKPTATVQQRYAEPIQRSLIINGALVTVSPSAVKSSDLQSLQERWFASSF